METVSPEAARVLERLMADCEDEDGQWSGADVCDALSDLIRRSRDTNPESEG